MWLPATFDHTPCRSPIAHHMTSIELAVVALGIGVTINTVDANKSPALSEGVCPRWQAQDLFEGASERAGILNVRAMKVQGNLTTH